MAIRIAGISKKTSDATYNPIVRTVAPTALGTIYAPTDLHMSIVARRRQLGGTFNLLTEKFVSSSTYSPNGYGPEQLQVLTISGAGTVATGNGKLTYTFGAGGWNFQLKARMRLPCAVAQVTTTIGTIGHTPAVGFGKDANNFVQFYYHGTDTTLHMQKVVAGVSTDINEAVQTVATGDQVRLVLNWPSVALWYRSGAVGSAGWRWIAEMDVSNWNMLSVAELNQWQPFIGDNLGSAGSGSFLDLSVDIPSGDYGMRDPTPCVFSDGTPFMKNGKYYFCYTVPDIAGTYQGNHMAVATLDPVSYQVETVAHLFFRTGAGTVAANYAGHFVYDEATDQFYVIHSNWGISGSAPTPMWLGTTSRDITSGVHLIPAVQLTLPGSTNGVTYDPALRKENGVWKLLAACGNGTNNFPAIWESTDLVTWTQTHYNTLHACEGQRWVKVGGTWYAIAGGVSSGDVFDFQCYDANLNYIGALSTWSAGFGSLPGYTGTDPGPAPHPCLIAVSDDDRTRYVLVTFDRTNYGAGKAATGACVVMEAAEIPTGHEFARKSLSRS